MTLPTIRARLSRALLLALLGWGTLVVLLVGMVTRLAVDDIELPANRSDGRPLDVGHRPFGCLG